MDATLASVGPIPYATRYWPWVARGFGALLFVTALLKLESLVGMLPGQSLLLGSPRSVFAVATIELGLAAWLCLAAKNDVLPWVGATCFFAVALIAAISLSVQGVAYCPCFGRAHVNPWWAVLLDCAALLALTVARPSTASLPAFRADLANWRQQASPLAMGGGLVVIVLVAAVLWFPPSLVSRLRGDVLIIDTERLDVGAGSGGQWTTMAVSLRNVSASRIVVTGALPVVAA